MFLRLTNTDLPAPQSGATRQAGEEFWTALTNDAAALDLASTSSGHAKATGTLRNRFA